MSNNTLVAKIKANAEEQIVKIKSVSDAAVVAVETETKSKVDALTLERTAVLEKQKQHIELVEVSKAKQLGNIKLQQAKRDQIDAVFSEVEADLVSQDSVTYVNYFTKLAKEQLPGKLEVKVVRTAKNRTEEAKDILKAVGVSGEVEADSAIKAGLVVYGSDGVYDLTLERLMRERKAVIEMELVQKVIL